MKTIQAGTVVLKLTVQRQRTVGEKIGPNKRGVDTNKKNKEEGHAPIVTASCVRANPNMRETHMVSGTQNKHCILS